jgi:pyridoxamine 5'-phosphate oxidase
MSEAQAAGVLEPSAMALATVSAEGVPSVRYVLCRGIDGRGVRFFTNYESRKARDLDTTHRAAAAFHWALLARQVRVEGRVVRATPEESDAYFAARPRGHQLAAAVSPQSRAIESLDGLHARFEELATTLGEGPVPRPSEWGGYWLLADAVELWQGKPDRMHDRVRFERHGDEWRPIRLAP